MHRNLRQRFYSRTDFLEQGVIVTYDQHSQSSLFPLFQQEIPYLRLGDKIQHGRNLIAEEKAGIRMQSPGKAEPLQFPAG